MLGPIERKYELARAYLDSPPGQLIARTAQAARLQKLGRPPSCLDGGLLASWTVLDLNQWPPPCQWDHEKLYRTKTKGRWVLYSWSQRQGTMPTYEYLSDEKAREWPLKNHRDEAVEQYFGKLPEEEDFSTGGRPEIGGVISTAIGDERLERVVARAKEESLSRAEAIRQLIDRGLEQPPRVQGDARQLSEDMDRRSQEYVWDLLRKGGIEPEVTASPDGTFDLFKSGERISFGPAIEETGEAASGWDWTKYSLEDGVWEYVTNDWAETDAEMLAILLRMVLTAI